MDLTPLQLASPLEPGTVNSSKSVGAYCHLPASFLRISFAPSVMTWFAMLVHFLRQRRRRRNQYLSPRSVMPNPSLNRTHCGRPTFGLKKPSPNASLPQWAG